MTTSTSLLSKARLEALSDGVFSIVMTLLIIEIHVPTMVVNPSNLELLTELWRLIPLVASYFVSFAVLAMFWIAHNFFYGAFTKNINRQLTLINILYLSFIAFIPFSAHLIGTFPNMEVAVVVYGLNVFAIGVLSASVLRYAIVSHELDTSHVSSRLLKQAKIRTFITPMFTLVGILLVPVYIPLAMFFYAFPIVFNIIPGMLDAAERLFGVRLD